LPELDLRQTVGNAAWMDRPSQTYVIGAGLAGLAAAYRLRKEYTVLEKTGHVGGLCETTDDKGYRFDRTGHLLHLRHSKIRRLVNRILENEPLEIERNSRIFSSGVYTQYPFQANTHGLPVEIVAHCLTEFINAVSLKREKTVLPRTFEEFILQHFGKGVARHFMIPYNAKLWGVHPREITADWCRRFVPIPSVDEVVNGAFGLAQTGMGYNARFLYPATGIEELPLALARKVENIEFRTAPRAIDYKRQRLQIGGSWMPYKALVSTIPLPVLIKLLVNAPKKVTEAASKLRCTKLRYLDIALSKPAGTKYHWSYVPERKYPFYRVGCYSNFSSAMAPRGKSNLYVELASRQPIELKKLMPKVIEGLTEMSIVRRASDVEFVRPRLINYGYVIYDKNYVAARSMLLEWLEQQKIFSAGRYARWEYAAMEDALVQGFEAADKVKELY
jgi:protoporphyrinogen oxidase